MDPNTEVDSNIDVHITFSGRCKDAKVLKQNREFDEEDDEAVDNR